MEDTYFPQIKDIVSAKRKLSDILQTTPLMENRNLSKNYSANILLKREDLQMVRSYKIRGAYNKIISLVQDEKPEGIVCASAGNHAQGVAYSCARLGIKGYIFMPTTTPKQKISQVKMFGGEQVEIILTGDTFDDTAKTAQAYCSDHHLTFIHPFDDPRIIEGQATVALEIIESANTQIDYVFVPIGGGGLASGISAYFKQVSPETKVIGVEPAGAASMKASIQKGEILELPEIDKFVDGAAVKRPGQYTYRICKEALSDIVVVPEGKVCSSIIELYNKDAIVVEPAGALSVAALDEYKEEIKGKNVVCIISGSNNDITRTEDIKERSLLYEGLKHYFLISFPQRAGALLSFVEKVLGPTDDITFFEYKKKNNKEQGPATIGIEVQQKEDLEALMSRMTENGIKYEYLNDNKDLFELLIA